MNFSAWSIHRPLPAILLFILLGAVGLFGFQQLAVSRFPDIAFPGITVTVVQPSATPTQLETEVARKIEDSIATLPGIKNLVSTVVEGSSTTFVEFRIGKDLNEALDEVRDAVTRVRTDLPQDIEEPIVAKIDVERDDRQGDRDAPDPVRPRRACGQVAQQAAQLRQLLGVVRCQDQAHCQARPSEARWRATRSPMPCAARASSRSIRSSFSSESAINIREI